MDLEKQSENKNPNKKPEVSRRNFLKMAAIGGGGLLAFSQFGGIAEACQLDVPKTDKKTEEHIKACGLGPKTLKAKNFEHLPGNIAGLSESQLKQHIALYTKYVKKYNAVDQLIQDSRKSGNYKKARNYQLRQSYALNGVILHDLYFSNLKNDVFSPETKTKALIERDFGSIANYFADLRSVAKSMRGWAITGYNMLDGRIHNYGLDTHDHGSPLGVYPLMVLDVYEHAYMVDFGTNRGAYLDAFVELIDWTTVEQRLEKALTHTASVT